jgi:hypothetical protein
MTNPHVGSSFAAFLEEEGLRDEVERVAEKRVLAWQIEQAMRAGAREETRSTGEARATGGPGA